MLTTQNTNTTSLMKGQNLISPEGMKAIVIEDNILLNGSTINCLMQNGECREIKVINGDFIENGWLCIQDDGSRIPAISILL